MPRGRSSRREGRTDARRRTWREVRVDDGSGELLALHGDALQTDLRLESRQLCPHLRERREEGDERRQRREGREAGEALNFDSRTGRNGVGGRAKCAGGRRVREGESMTRKGEEEGEGWQGEAEQDARQ
jgi:hypothetical protein